MRIGIAADHAGFELKQELAEHIIGLGYELDDLGAHEYNALDDYPDFSLKLAEAVRDEKIDRGVLICGSGIGASIAANKVRGIRAGVCGEPYSAHQGVEHDDMNVVVVGSRITGVEVAKEIVSSFLGAQFSGEERHVRRLNKVLEIEAMALKGDD